MATREQNEKRVRDAEEENEHDGSSKADLRRIFFERLPSIWDQQNMPEWIRLYADRDHETDLIIDVKELIGPLGLGDLIVPNLRWDDDEGPDDWTRRFGKCHQRIKGANWSVSDSSSGDYEDVWSDDAESDETEDEFDRVAREQAEIIPETPPDINFVDLAQERKDMKATEFGIWLNEFKLVVEVGALHSAEHCLTRLEGTHEMHTERSLLRCMTRALDEWRDEGVLEARVKQELLFCIKVLETYVLNTPTFTL